MICGVVSAASGDSGGNPYSGALAVMDFITSDYWIGDVESTAAAMIDRPDLITASGLNIDWNMVGGGGTNAIGEFLTLLIAADWTMVIEVVEDDPLPMYLFFMRDSSSIDVMWLQTDTSTVECYDEPDPGANRNTIISGVIARPSPRRVAITRTNAKLVLSVNGSAINSHAVATSSPSADKFAFGADTPDVANALMVGFIQRVILYSPQSDAALPGLSTV